MQNYITTDSFHQAVWVVRNPWHFSLRVWGLLDKCIYCFVLAKYYELTGSLFPLVIFCELGQGKEWIGVSRDAMA